MILVDFVCATRIHIGFISWFYEVDPDQNSPKWSGSGWIWIRIHNTAQNTFQCPYRIFLFWEHFSSLFLKDMKKSLKEKCLTRNCKKTSHMT